MMERTLNKYGLLWIKVPRKRGIFRSWCAFGVPTQETLEVRAYLAGAEKPLINADQASVVETVLPWSKTLPILEIRTDKSIWTIVFWLFKMSGWKWPGSKLWKSEATHPESFIAWTCSFQDYKLGLQIRLMMYSLGSELSRARQVLRQCHCKCVGFINFGTEFEGSSWKPSNKYTFSPSLIKSSHPPCLR